MGPNMDGQKSKDLKTSDHSRSTLPNSDEVESLLRLAEQGDAEAQLRLGLMFLEEGGSSQGL